MTNKLGALLMVLVFCLIPMAIFSEEPGLTPAGIIQLSVIVAAMVSALLLIRRETIIGRVGVAFAAYSLSTFVSNVCAFMLIPHLIH